MVKTYDKNNTEHERNLRNLYEKMFQEQTELENSELLSERWKDLGFQSKNPRTDFRGGGHLGLLCLLFMTDFYPSEWFEMVRVTKEREEVMWLTAISSINITHGLVIYLYLNELDDYLMP
jgi:hypothetical protein